LTKKKTICQHFFSSRAFRDKLSYLRGTTLKTKLLISLFALCASVLVANPTKAESFKLLNQPSLAFNTNNNFVKIDGYSIVTLYSANSSDPDQTWTELNGNWGKLYKNTTTGRCLNARYLSNGGSVNTWPCNAADPDQNFSKTSSSTTYQGNIPVAGSFIYQRLNSSGQGTGFCLNAPNRYNGGRVMLWQCNVNDVDQRILKEYYLPR
jgi:hypothetical protein